MHDSNKASQTNLLNSVLERVLPQRRRPILVRQIEDVGGGGGREGGRQVVLARLREPGHPVPDARHQERPRQGS